MAMPLSPWIDKAKSCAKAKASVLILNECSFLALTICRANLTRNPKDRSILDTLHVDSSDWK
ncbi:hypothetical protein M378DRAFT_288051 [Amanita muscaria Koide BX008]|uniref:Uncharacterized protein n=1 Tax=Amanita muscaria (strain Koide BX008) TaxID=946122 RepID=A0A0C2WQE4_AMAMK|nr:hypothetical protein M378DRAFT_288051 [Amanita muscaria Koide BX008]